MVHRKALFQIITSGVLLIFAAYSAYVNAHLKRKLAEQTTTIDSLTSYQRTSTWIDDREGARLPNDILRNTEGDTVGLLRLLKLSGYSILVIEPENTCSTCLETTLATWKKASASSSLERQLGFFIVSMDEGRRAYLLARKFQLENHCYVDRTRELSSFLPVPPTLPFALFADKNGKVVYAQVLSWRSPERFVSFLKKVDRYLREEM
ncbi:MAG: hypothetical protein ACP5JH_02280 [Bacteroidota bacterium]